MIGLMIIGFFALYLLISAFAVGGAARWAKKHGRSAWKWGGLAVFVMYNLVFWDFIPTLVAHKYYCETQAGFWVYKTPEQWRQENLGVAETLTRKEPADEYKIEKVGNGVSTTYAINQRIKVLNRVTHATPLLNERRNEALLIDGKTNLVLTRKVSFAAGRSSGAPNSVSDFRFWVNFKECSGTTGNSTPMVWGEAENSYRNMGEEK